MVTREFRLAMSPAERAAHVPGTGVQLFNGKMPLLRRSLADVYDIQNFDKKRKVGWVWINRDSGRAD